ncbi:hypothetical protein A7P96_08015 [Eikenella sp. NML03-A-027]|nr:hypothetical protein A7P96_08015 [Eikenella sp. NML03-A-027]
MHREELYNAQDQAQLRIYGQYGHDVVHMIPNSSCEQWAENKADAATPDLLVACRAASATFRWACLPLSAATL